MVLTGKRPLMTYIGALLTKPPESTSASAPHLWSSLATSMQSSVSMPPLKPSRVFIFTKMATLPFPASVTAFMQRFMNLILFSSEPPYSSFLWFVYGDRNCDMR